MIRLGWLDMNTQVAILWGRGDKRRCLRLKFMTPFLTLWSDIKWEIKKLR